LIASDSLSLIFFIDI